MAVYLHHTNKQKLATMKKVELNKQVIGSKGEGIITKIITKSTGYVEVTYNSGIVKKEMAFNLTDVNGESLKAKPSTSTNGKVYYSDFHSKLNYALRQEIGRDNLSTETMLNLR